MRLVFEGSLSSEPSSNHVYVYSLASLDLHSNSPGQVQFSAPFYRGGDGHREVEKLAGMWGRRAMNLEGLTSKKIFTKWCGEVISGAERG